MGRRISRKTGYKIFNRYKESGFEALTDRSRRPVRYANQLAHVVATNDTRTGVWNMRTPIPNGAMWRVLLVALLSNSGAHAAADIAGSCNNAASGFCNEFTGSSYKAASVQRVCEGQKMMFLAGACPTEGRVGSCLTYKGKSNESHNRYYAKFPGFGITPRGGVATAAESQCTKLKGEWTPN